ncbi:MAG: NfeD family protein [Bacteroidaceae bacterium]|nr:NfeD family protein [Bacteroidaceae bacterium]
MMDKFLALELPMQVFWGLAIISSVFFLVQTIMAFLGLDADTDDGAGFEDVEMGGVSGYFSFRNLVNFMLGYGWGGIVLHDVIPNLMWLQVAALGIGVLFVIIFVFILRQIMKLSTDKTFHIEEAIGLIADTYLRIPGEKKGSGKVMVSVRGSMHEIEAITEGEAIPTGAKVRVVKAIGTDLLEVERI